MSGTKVASSTPKKRTESEPMPEATTKKKKAAKSDIGIRMTCNGKDVSCERFLIVSVLNDESTKDDTAQDMKGWERCPQCGDSYCPPCIESGCLFTCEDCTKTDICYRCAEPGDEDDGDMFRCEKCSENHEKKARSHDDDDDDE